MMAVGRFAASPATAVTMGWLLARFGRMEWLRLPARPDAEATGSRAGAFASGVQHDFPHAGGFLVVGGGRGGDVQHRRAALATHAARRVTGAAGSPRPPGAMRRKGEPGGNPGLPRSGERERPPSYALRPSYGPGKRRPVGVSGPLDRLKSADARTNASANRLTGPARAISRPTPPTSTAPCWSPPPRTATPGPSPSPYGTGCPPSGPGWWSSAPRPATGRLWWPR